MIRLAQHLVLVCALLTAVAASHVSLGVKRGDTNGDAAVNVLDLQKVIAEVLAGKKAPVGDVNRDGKVDILDFQALVNQAQHAAPAPSAPRPADRGTTVNTRVANEAVVRAVRLKPVSPEEGKSASSLGARPARVVFTASARTERHLQHLISNAPPTQA